MAGGGPVGQVAANPFGPQQQPSTPMGGGASPLNTGGGMMAEPQVIDPSRFTNYGQGNGGGFGGQNQTAGTMGTTPFSSVNSTTQQDMMGGGGRGGSGGSFGDFLQRSLGGGFGGQQQQYDPTAAASDMMYRPQVEQPISGGFAVFDGQQGPMSFDQFRNQPRFPEDPMPTQADYQRYTQNYQPGRSGMQVAQNPFQPQQPASFDPRAIAGNPQGFQQYMQLMQQREQQRPGSTMLAQQQPQFNPYQQQRQQFNPYQRQNPYQQQRQQFNPYQQQRQQYRQPMGLQSLMGRLGGRGMPQAQPRMSMDMPETFGRERRYDMPARDYSRIGSAGVAAPPEMVAAPAVMGPANDYWANSW